MQDMKNKEKIKLANVPEIKVKDDILMGKKKPQNLLGEIPTMIEAFLSVLNK